MIQGLKDLFLEFHRKAGFRLYETFPLVIDDPTILFTNATVTPFKPMFMGVAEKESFALVQRCLRLGGSGGDLDSLRSNTNHASLFDMLGSGFFNVNLDDAVAYFIRALEHLGLSKDRLVFSMLADHGFDQALERAGVRMSNIRLFEGAEVMPHEWSFGEGDLHGCGVVARYIPDGVYPQSDDVVQELSRCVQIGRLVHIDGVDRGRVVDRFPYTAYDMGIGLNRVEMALTGSCEESLASWRLIARHLMSSVPAMSAGDAHYAANLYLIAEALVREGLLPGKNRQAYALRNIMRALIEEIWVQSKATVDISKVLADPLRASSACDNLERVLSQEEGAMRKVLATAAQKRSKHPQMTEDELRSTFGIRPSLLKFVK